MKKKNMSPAYHRTKSILKPKEGIYLGFNRLIKDSVDIKRNYVRVIWDLRDRLLNSDETIKLFHESLKHCEFRYFRIDVRFSMILTDVVRKRFRYFWASTNTRAFYMPINIELDGDYQNVVNEIKNIDWNGIKQLNDEKEFIFDSFATIEFIFFRK